MQINPESMHYLFEGGMAVGSGAAALVVGYFGLALKNGQLKISNDQLAYRLEAQREAAQVKAELIANTQEIRADLFAHNSALATNLAVHIAKDDATDLKHESRITGIDGRLERMGKVMEKILDRQFEGNR